MADIRQMSRGFISLSFGLLAGFLKWIIMRFIFWGVRRSGLTVEGLDNLPPKGSYIVVSSHQLPITAEATLCSGATGRKVVPWASARQKSATSIRVYWFYRHHSWGIIPLEGEPGMDVLEAMERRSRRELEHGKLVWIAPEGKFGFSIGLRKGYSSFVSVLANLSDYSLVPMSAFGAGTCEWHFDLYRPHPDMKVVFGKPFRLTSDFPKHSVAAQSRAADEIMLRIAALMPPEMRGYYSDFPNGEFRYTADVTPQPQNGG